MADGKIDSLISQGTYVSAAAVIVGGLTIGQWVALVGAVVMVANFCVNAYHKRAMRLLREREVDILEQRK